MRQALSLYLSTALVLLPACAAKAPVQAFPDPPPPLEAPELTELPPPTEDAAPLAAPMVPGEPPPYTDTDTCTVTNRATAVPEDQVLELLQNQDRAAYWEERAMVVQEGRERDRAYCDSLIAPLEQDRQALAQDNRALRWAVPGAFILGVFLGALAAAGGQTLGGQ